MRLQDVFDELERRGWYLLDENIKLENLTHYRLYAHKRKPGVIITIVGSPEMYISPSALANIYAQAEIETTSTASSDEPSSQSMTMQRRRFS